MRPGWPQAMRMPESALPFRRMLSIDERLEQAAARPVIIPQSIVVDYADPPVMPTRTSGLLDHKVCMSNRVGIISGCFG
jgi:hypothetical protein